MISEETRTKINLLSGITNQDQQQSTNSNDKDKVKVKDKDETENKHKRFENEGVVFKAKLIGSELVMEPRGDKMCQNSIQRLKAIIKGTNSHKKRIVLKISYDGVKVYDEKTNEILHHHEVSQISYIASDDTDSRTFGYVSDVPNKAHQFICFKTSGPAINVMSVISSLFDAIVERKNQADKAAGKQSVDITTPTTTPTTNTTSSAISKHVDILTQDSIDLIGDSGIMDGDSSIISSDEKSPQAQLTSGSILIANNYHHQYPVLLPPPSSLPRPTPPMMAGQSRNRSLVYNHSSVSLSDAALTHQSSFISTTSSNQNDSYVDRYAVFNEIDNWPSIFESTSLGNVNTQTLNNVNTQLGSSGGTTFRQTNPFDDDFFA